MHVRDVMSHPAITCPVDSALDAAARLMWEYDCGVVLVVSDDGRLGGIVTDRDICLAAYMHHKPLHLIPLAKAMVKPVISVHEEDGAESAEQLMRENRIRRLAVVDAAGRPVGVLSLDDLAQLALQEARADRDRELVRTLAAVGGPRSRPAESQPLVTLKK